MKLTLFLRSEAERTLAVGETFRGVEIIRYAKTSEIAWTVETMSR